jgi:hypothetical protein
VDKRSEIEKYGFHNYDDFLCLRPPRLLIASLIYLCRGFVVVALIGLSQGDITWLNDLVGTETPWSGYLAAAPAALVLYALGARAPSARAFVRWTWRHGRALMSLSALSYVAFAVAQVGFDPRRWLSGAPFAVQATVLAELGIIGYVLLSSRVRQTFLDFPSE